MLYLKMLRIYRTLRAIITPVDTCLTLLMVALPMLVLRSSKGTKSCSSKSSGIKSSLNSTVISSVSRSMAPGWWPTLLVSCLSSLEGVAGLDEAGLSTRPFAFFLSNVLISRVSGIVEVGSEVCVSVRFLWALTTLWARSRLSTQD